MSPVIEELRELVNIEKYDADTDVEMVDKYGIMSLPTMVIVKDEKEVDRIHGLISKDNLLSLLAIS